MSVIALIPARCGSKSIKYKNIKTFCQKPLIYWNLLAIENTEEIDIVYVATDCTKIEKTVLDFNFKKTKIYSRSDENASDKASTESVMIEFIESLKPSALDLLILVQATSPFTQSEDFSLALEKVKHGDSLLSCVRQKRFFWSEDGHSKNYDYKNRPRRQDFDGELMENGAFYINSVGNILKYQNRLSGKICIHEMKEYCGLELDEPDDWLMGEQLMKKHILAKKNLPKAQIKLVLMDVDGVLTDAGMYYSENGDELKKFNTHDGKGIERLRLSGVKTGIITSENTELVKRRALKLKVDHLYQGQSGLGKLDKAKQICKMENLSLSETAYIGDDINCFELLQAVGFAGCPSNALPKIKSIKGIRILHNNGGNGAVREFAELILDYNKLL